MPMRGKNIFHATHYKDVGVRTRCPSAPSLLVSSDERVRPQAFQFYGLGVDNMVVGMTMTRGGGFIAWGQDRGAFVNPNLMNEFLGNTVAEGLRAEHQGTPLGMGNWGDPLQSSAHVFAIADANPDLNRYIVFRGNRAHSNGGFFIGGSSDVLVEGNAVNNTPSQSVSGQGHYHIAEKARGRVYMVGNN